MSSRRENNAKPPGLFSESHLHAAHGDADDGEEDEAHIGRSRPTVGTTPSHTFGIQQQRSDTKRAIVSQTCQDICTNCTNAMSDSSWIE